jgi:hypothetical protein
MYRIHIARAYTSTCIHKHMHMLTPIHTYTYKKHIDTHTYARSHTLIDTHTNARSHTLKRPGHSGLPWCMLYFKDMTLEHEWHLKHSVWNHVVPVCVCIMRALYVYVFFFFVHVYVWICVSGLNLGVWMCACAYRHAYMHLHAYALILRNNFRR